VPTPSTTYNLDQISQYLWSVANLKSNAFNNGTSNLNSGRDIVLMVEGYALYYGINQNLSGLQGVTNDVYRLCGSMLQQANEINATGSGGIVPTPSATGYYQPYAIDHTVTLAESNQTSISNSEWVNLIGLVELFINQQVFQLNVGFTYIPGSGALNFDLSGTSGNVYTLQTGDVITSGGLTKIVTP